MKICTIVVNDNRACSITVNAVSNNIDVLGFNNGETIEIDFSWTAAPLETAMVTARFEARIDKDDAAGSGPIDQTGLINLPGTDGTVTATFTVDLSVLTAGRTYADVITLTDGDGNTKTWAGFVRVLP